MLEPIERERIEAAIKSAVKDAGINIAEAGRRVGKGSSWLSSVLQRVREGHTLTVETVRILRGELPTVEEHLTQAGWSTFGATKSRPIIATRSTEHLRLHRNALMRKRDEIDKEIREITAQIAELEEMHRENAGG
jgi:hypothetical protein